MIVETIVIGGAYLLHKKWSEIEIRWIWSDIIKSANCFTNHNGKSLKLFKYIEKEYGYDLFIEFPYGFTLDDFYRNIDVFREGLKLEDLIVKPSGNMAILNCITERVFTNFSTKGLPPHVLMIAQGAEHPITVDMNKFPHMLIGGDTGTGKSRLLFCILTNLIATTDNADIKLIQMRKNDLEVFENCKQVESSRKDLESIKDMLKAADEECRRRELLIKPLNGDYNISDYNNNHPKVKLKYEYIVIEEFSFLQNSAGDTKIEKKLKNECLKYIKGIVNVGRSSGVFLITALQKPTKDSIPSDIKAQLTTRISLTIKDQGTSQVVLGNGDAADLKEREVIIRTLGDEYGTTFTIGHEEIISNIKNKIIDSRDEEERNLKTKQEIGKAAIFG